LIVYVQLNKVCEMTKEECKVCVLLPVATQNI
jgi:hypothetical protein